MAQDWLVPVKRNKKMTLHGFLMIFLGGGSGALLRFISTHLIDTAFRANFPLGTFFVNIIGSLCIGFLYKIFETLIIADEFRLFIIVGFLGGYTTFSTYSLDTAKYILSGNYKSAILNIILSNILCLLSVIIGIMISKIIIK